jgi:hypothetical protein
MTVDQTDDRDAFALGGRNETLTVSDLAPTGAGDAALFALITEHRRLDKEYGRLHAEVERLEYGVEASLPKAEVEYGVVTTKGGKRRSLIAGTEEDLRSSEAEERTEANFNEILSTYPVTIEGADAVRDLSDECEREELVDHVVECYRTLAIRRAVIDVGGDHAMLSLFRRWRELECHATAADGGDVPDAIMDPLNAAVIEIADTPASGLVGLAIKAYVTTYLGADVPQDGQKAAIGTLASDCYGTGGELYYSARLFRGLVADAARFVPELHPLVEGMINSPSVLPEADDEEGAP